MLQSVASHGYLRLMICSIRHIVFRLNLFILLSLPMFCFGQDLHFSQYYLHPMDLSPAACGIFEGDLRISAAYRSQWRSVPVNYQTFMGSVDWKAFEKGNNLVSLGLLFDRDEAGDAGLSWLQIQPTVALAHALGEQHVLSVGFGLAFVQRSFDIGALTFKNQWGGDVFDPGLPSGENFNASSKLAASLSTGLLWFYRQNDSRTEMTLGTALAHANRPVVSLGDFSERLAFRTSTFLSSYWQLGERNDLFLSAAYQQMAKARELVFGTGLRYILSTGLANESSVQGSISCRIGDAIVPAVQFSRNNWTIGLSYDINISAFNEATNGKGGIEIAAIWRRVPVPEFKTVKICPVF